MLMTTAIRMGLGGNSSGEPRHALRGEFAWIRQPSNPRLSATASIRCARACTTSAGARRATLFDQGLEAREPRVAVEPIRRQLGRLERVEKLACAVPSRPRRPAVRQRVGELPKVDAIAPRIGARSFRVLDLAAGEGLPHDLGQLADAVVLVVRAHVERLVPDELRSEQPAAAPAAAVMSRTCTRGRHGVPSLMIMTLPVVNAQAARLLSTTSRRTRGEAP